MFGHHLRQKSAKIRGPPGVGFNFTTTRHFDIGNKKLFNIAEPTEGSDALNLRKSRSELYANNKDFIALDCNIKIYKGKLKICKIFMV